ncbi:MAG: SlyX family protein [Deltaproteobacteria bacterium]
MDDAAMREERFTRLEIKASYLEKLTAELNDVVVGQANLIDDLVQRLQRLERQLQASGEEREMPQERPPHY